MSKSKVISYSLWGNNPMYCIGAVKNALLSRQLLPDYECVFTVSKDVPKNIVDTLRHNGATVVVTDEPANHIGMFWRFTLATMDDKYTHFLSRDCDSRLTYKEIAEIRAWESSDKMFHSIIAHPYHNIPILGGLWGVKLSPEFSALMNTSIKAFKLEDRYQIDQEFLIKCIYPHVKEKMYTSDMMYKEQNPDYSFIGEGYDEFDQPREMAYRTILKDYHTQLSNMKN